MDAPHVRSPRTIAGIFLAGLLAALPLAATLLIVVWALRLLFAYVGPGSFVGRGLVAIGLGGGSSEVVGYLIGVALVLAGIFALGVLVQTRLRHWLARAVDALILRIPVVRGIYGIAQRFVELLSPRRGDECLRSMRPVWCHFVGPVGVAVLGLLSVAEPIELGGVSLPAGAYTLFMLPAVDGSAKLLVNRQVGQWGIDPYDETQELARIDLKKTTLTTPVDQFTMGVERDPSGDGVLKLALRDGTRIVVNSHRAARQIWLAAVSSAWHFDPVDGGVWRSSRGSEELRPTLAKIIHDRIGLTVSFDAPR